MNAYEAAAVIQWVMSVLCVFGAGLLMVRQRHAHTAFTLLIGFFWFRIAFQNWERGGHAAPDWVIQDNLVLINNVALLIMLCALLYEGMERRHL